MAEDKTRVIFRVDSDGNVFALFPELQASGYLCTCYAHIGQHSAADYTHCIRTSRPALPAEYAPLARELTAIGYTLHISQRRYHRLGKWTE